MTSTSDEAFRKHIASFNDMATAEEWKRRYEAHDSLVKALEAAQATLRHVHDLLIDRQTFSRTRETINAECRSITAALSQAKGGK